MADPVKNFAYGTILTAPSPATTGTSFVLNSGQGALFPAPATDGAFNAVIWPTGVQPTAANAEIVRITARTTDTFTMTRIQESTSARTIIVGDQVALSITALTIASLSSADKTETLTNKTITSPKINENVVLTATATQLNDQVLATNDGWISANESWSYASATTITVPSGAVAKYKKGDKLRWKQGGSYKYSNIVAVSDTLLTIPSGIDFTVANSAITDNYFSHGDAIGFPDYFNFTSSVAAGSGTYTTVTCSMTFKIIQNMVFLSAILTITTNGTAGTFTSLSLPLTSTGVATGVGREVAVAGGFVLCDVSGATLYIRKYDGNYYGANGYVINLGVNYRF